MFIHNSNNEILSISRLIGIQEADLLSRNTVDLICNRSRFKISRFILNFFSSMAVDDEVDVIIIDNSYENLENLVKILNLQQLSQSEIISCESEARGFCIDLKTFISESDVQEDSKINEEASEVKTIQNELSKSNTNEEKTIEVSVSIDHDPTIEDTVVNTVEVEHEAFTMKTECETNNKDTNVIPEENTKELNSKSMFFKYQLEKCGNPMLEMEPCPKRKYLKRIMKITCPICGKVFERKDNVENYKKHYRRHEMDMKDCGCNITFQGKKEKVFHILTVHEGGHGCATCYAVLKSAHSLEEHNKIHEKSQEKVLKCEHCPYETQLGVRRKGVQRLRLHELNKHINVKPETGEREREMFNCSICEKDGNTKQFGSRGLLNKHLREVHSPKTCSICGLFVKSLQSHLDNIHTDEGNKKFQCEDCGKGFVEKYRLTQHRESIHLGVQFPCRYDKCERVYRNQSNRNAHEKKRHGNNFIRRKDN